ncbi:hypothetical protein LF599_04625 [Pseudodesulfovibrio thermohalotolerans]|uniref:hypothetical protein n=1 Tax=Pseudodesulfovibrio thermohalotolerans TaxID=2880651 RepID=UPI002441BCE0|nr:hypothetical protein [Pseudodesulfovibrio thermohalotolerans]WFS63453.1 hypothetical protein LF599_04625 [Pseudodesulfovibrio thermohalotolerans]
MALKDIIARDVSSDLFFRDFGGRMAIDGVELDVDVRDEGTGEGESRRSGRREGVSIQVKTIYWRAVELAKPKPRQEMVVDGHKWTVSKAEEKSGLVKVQMYRELS